MDFHPAPDFQQPTEARRRPRHNRWLVAIGAFKIFQGVLFLALAIGALRLLHKDLVDVAERLILALRFNPENRLVNLTLEKVALIDQHRLRQISAAIFLIAAMDFTEGLGLVLEKTWAEYVTLILTASFLPWEGFELVRHPSWLHLGLFVINAAVVIYLVQYVRTRIWERHRERHGDAVLARWRRRVGRRRR